MATTKKPAEPLTAAQLEVVQQLVADRRAQILADVTLLVNELLAPVIEAINLLAQDAVKIGGSIALRANSGKLLGARGGGPTVEDEHFALIAKSHPGPWESYTVERGQG